MPVSFLFAGLKIVVDAIHVRDAPTQSFRSAFPGGVAPSFSTLTQMQPLETLWVHVRRDGPMEWPLDELWVSVSAETEVVWHQPGLESTTP